jgi:hypothetical protein
MAVMAMTVAPAAKESGSWGGVSSRKLGTGRRSATSMTLKKVAKGPEDSKRGS